MLPGEKIIHVLPQDYIIDNEKGITEPIGMCGGRMEANFHIITGQVSALKNILRCLDRSDLSSSGVILEPLASADAVLSKEEKEAGVALIDIGGGTTDIAIFHDGIIRHTAVIALGGDIITEDIKEGCSIIKDQAEMLKICHGSALASESKQNQVVVIPGLGGHKPKEISLKALASIIQARMQDIIDHVQYEIKNSGYEKKLIAGIVLTGGGAKLRNIIQFIEFFTGMNARIGYPNEHLGKSPEEVASPMYSTSIGLVLKGFEEIELRKTFFESAKSNVKGATATKNAGGGFLEGLFAKARDFFEDDSEKNS
jgi:cell division protein FtsA